MRRRHGKTQAEISPRRLLFSSTYQQDASKRACFFKKTRILVVFLLALFVARQFYWKRKFSDWWAFDKDDHTPIPSYTHVVWSADNTQVPEWLDSYIRFHNSSICYQNGAYHLKDNAKYLVYYCHSDTTCGGIGDRINGIMSLLYLAMCTERVLIIDMPSPYPLQDILEPNKIQWNIQYPSDYQYHKIGKSYNWPPFKDPSKLGANVRGWAVTTGNWVGAWLWDSQSFQQYRKQHDKNSTLKKDAHYMYRWGFWTLFRFNEKVLRRSEQFKRAANLTFHNQTLPYTAIHVRTGNGGAGSSFRDPPRHTGEEAFRQFLSCGRLLEQELMAVNTTSDDISAPNNYQRDMIVLSDNDETKSLMQSWDTVGNVKIVEGINVYHVDKSKPRPLTRQFWTVNPRQANLDAWAELVLLIDSECLARSRSGFSEVAHRIVASNPVNYKRCGVQFDHCTAKDVKEAVSALDTNIDNGTATASNNVWVVNKEGEV